MNGESLSFDKEGRFEFNDIKFEYLRVVRPSRVGYLLLILF